MTLHAGAPAALYFGARCRKSPYFEATRRAGCKVYGIYNHMYLPKYYGDPIEEYWHLLNHVTLWDAEYIGKAALERIRSSGVQHKLVGVEWKDPRLSDGPTEFWPAFQGRRRIGHVTAAVWSPRLEKNIGYVWVPIELAGPGNDIEVETPQGRLTGRTAALPFIDPQKKVPKG